MTYKAREVLADCRVALAMLEDEKKLQPWRIVWVSAVALVRAVGHVLDKVDGESNATIRRAASERYKLWKSNLLEHLIFREFIDKTRNNILKEYQIDIHPLEAVPILLQGVRRNPNTVEAAVEVSDILELDENVYRPLLGGPWDGEDAREVLKEAIEWWEKELTIIDRAVSGGDQDSKGRGTRRKSKNSKS